MAEDDEDIEISTYGNDVVVMLAPYRGLWWLAPFRVTSEVQEGVKDGETTMASAPAHESSLCMSSLEGSPWVGVIRCCVEWREERRPAVEKGTGGGADGEVDGEEAGGSANGAGLEDGDVWFEVEVEGGPKRGSEKIVNAMLRRVIGSATALPLQPDLPRTRAHLLNITTTITIVAVSPRRRHCAQLTTQHHAPPPQGHARFDRERGRRPSRADREPGQLPS